VRVEAAQGPGLLRSAQTVLELKLSSLAAAVASVRGIPQARSILCPGSVDEDEVAAFMLGEKPTALYEHAKTLHGHLDRCPYGPPRIRIEEAARPGARRPGAA
jgi:hypothetical protein